MSFVAPASHTHSQTSRGWAAARCFTVAVVVVAVACGDARISQLDAGISKDSTIALLGVGAPADDSLPNFYRHEQYLTDGKFFDIYLYDPRNRKIWKDPLVSDKELTPIVMVDSTLEGWGWAYMDELTAKYRIQIRAAKPQTE
ncbi:MAG: hypothetical protein ACT4OZ_10330 [Gemmatimonadota bacterium]